MKTITEFATITIKNAAKTRQDLLASGKTPEELPAALGEALKLEGDKLNFLIATLETVGDKFNDLKRVIVHSAAEGETAPSSARKIGEHYYTVEHFQSAQAAKGRDAGGRDDRGGRGGKGGGRGGAGGGRGGAGGGRGGAGDRDRGSRGPAGPAAGGERTARAPRPISTGPVSLPKPLSQPKSAPVVAPKATETAAQDSSETPTS